MDLDHAFAAAASSIGRTSSSEVAIGLRRLEAARRAGAHGDMERARRAAFIDSLELDEAAYELGRQYDKEGDLRSAAQWYRIAARGDHADAALRLGEVLDLLADRAARSGDDGVCDEQRAEYQLVQEAAKAYAEAYGAGYTEAADRLDVMLGAYSERRARDAGQRPAPATPPAPDAPGKRPCSMVRDFVPKNEVLHEEEIRLLSRHAAQCLPCLRDFATLAEEAAAGASTGGISNPYAEDLLYRAAQRATTLERDLRTPPPALTPCPAHGAHASAPVGGRISR